MTEGGPTVQRYGEEVYVIWSGRMTVTFGHWMDKHWGLQAEVTVQDEIGEIAWGQVLLVSSESRGKFVKSLNPEQQALFHVACRVAVGEYRKPPELRELQPRTRGALPWFWADWVPANETTVIYGDGDSGKSWLALALAVCALAGMPLAGSWPIAKAEAVIYVDYETTAESHEDRLAKLCRSLEVPHLTGFYYLQAARPMVDLADALRAYRARTQADLVILDSLGAATAGEPEAAQGAIGTMNVLRSLGPACTRMVVAHVSKLDAAAGGTRKVYGSVYNRNLPRANLELRRDETALEGLVTTLRVDKNNLLAKRPAPIGLALVGTEDGVTWQRTEPAASAIGVKVRLLSILSVFEEDALTTTEAANRSGLDPVTVRVTLNRLALEGVVKRVTVGTGGRYGNDRESTWIRILRNRNPVTD